VDLLAHPSLEARRRDVPASAAVFEPDTPAQNIYYIHQGQVRLFLIGPDNSARMLEVLGPDDWFGATSLAGAARYGSRAVAVTHAVITEVAASRLMGALPQFPAVAAELIRHLAGKLQAARQDSANLVFDDTKDRLIKALLHLSGTAAASPAVDGDGVVLRITHHQLAQAIGAARETVSLTLTQLRLQNLLRTGRNRLSFNPGALAQFHRGAQQVEKTESAE
jgi:CRP/FNR family transcriptional regulator